MKEYVAPSIDFYVFEMPESIMGTSECTGYKAPDCTLDGVCILDTPDCPAYFQCTADGICISDGVCIADLSAI